VRMEEIEEDDTEEGEPEQMTPVLSQPEQTGQYFIVKSIHTVIIVFTVFATVTLAYGSIRWDTDENRREIIEMKQDRLTKEMYEEGQRETERRLSSIERKIDSNRDLSDFKRDYDQKSMKH
jgi:hypothetical protein